jgi:hypothetical protein
MMAASLDTILSKGSSKEMPREATITGYCPGHDRTWWLQQTLQTVGLAGRKFPMALRLPPLTTAGCGRGFTFGVCLPYQRYSG